MKIKDVMNRNIITADKSTSIYDIAKKMKEFDIGCIPICEGKKIIGMLTDRDICVKIIANKDFENIESYISSNIITINEEENIAKALDKMRENKVKRLLVKKEDMITGIVSLSDLIEHIKNKDAILNTIKIIFKKETMQREKVEEIDSFYL